MTIAAEKSRKISPCNSFPQFLSLFWVTRTSTSAGNFPDFAEAAQTTANGSGWKVEKSRVLIPVPGIQSLPLRFLRGAPQRIRRNMRRRGGRKEEQPRAKRVAPTGNSSQPAGIRPKSPEISGRPAGSGHARIPVSHDGHTGRRTRRNRSVSLFFLILLSITLLIYGLSDCAHTPVCDTMQFGGLPRPCRRWP